jgi:ornithine cyclodeaminase/alanine dehydrogenase-like protein (mu-crystallin family)
MEHALIIVDSREAALKESGDIILAKVNGTELLLPRQERCVIG